MPIKPGQLHNLYLGSGSNDGTLNLWSQEGQAFSTLTANDQGLYTNANVTLGTGFLSVGFGGITSYGNVTAPNFIGTASLAKTASLALTASYVTGSMVEVSEQVLVGPDAVLTLTNYPINGWNLLRVDNNGNVYAQTSDNLPVTASVATTASYATKALSASYAPSSPSVSASFASSSISASYSTVAATVRLTDASSDSSQRSLLIGPFDDGGIYPGNHTPESSGIKVTANTKTIAATASFAVNATTASFALAGGSGGSSTSASWASSSLSSSFVRNALSASSLTASYLVIGSASATTPTTTTLELVNNSIDYTNTNGAGTFLTMRNTNAFAQNVLSSYVGSTLVAKWRTDYAGNVNWIAGSGYHTFYTSGDYPTGTVKMTINNDGKTVIAANDTTANARLHIKDTSEQLRIGYNSSHYYKTTVASNGSTTFDAVGTNPIFTFSDPVNITNLTASLFGTASNAVSASFATRAISASWAPPIASDFAISASWASRSLSASSVFNVEYDGGVSGYMNHIILGEPVTVNTWKQELTSDDGYFNLTANGGSTPAISTNPITNTVTINGQANVFDGNKLQVIGNISCSVVTGSLRGTATTASYSNKTSQLESGGYLGSWHRISSAFIDSGESVQILNEIDTPILTIPWTDGELEMKGLISSASYSLPTYASSSLTASVTMSANNTVYSGPTITVSPGVWVVGSTITIVRTTSTTGQTGSFTGWIRSGDNVYLNTQCSNATTTNTRPRVQMNLSNILSFNTTTALTASAVTFNGQGGWAMAHTALEFGSGSTATNIWAYKIG